MSKYFQSAKKKLAGFTKDRTGSDAVEMVSTTAMLMIMILIILMILIYVLEFNMVNFATKKCARTIETSGTVNMTTITNMYKEALGSTQYLPVTERKISVEADYIDSYRHIQLKDTFDVYGEAVYRVHVIRPGLYSGFHLDLPIKTHVVGMSEVYFRT